MPSLLGIDSGLTVTKAVLFDIDGTPIATARRRVPQSMPRPGHVERDMDVFWAMTAEAIGEALALSGRDPGDILAIAATAHGDGIYLLDRDKRPLGPAVLSLDTRAAGIADRWNAGEEGAQSLRLTGQLPHASAPSAILAWMREDEPERYRRIRHFIAAKDWLRYCLTGVIGTDRTEASTSFTDVTTQDYSDEIFAILGLSSLSDHRAPMSGSGEIVGGVTAEAARRTGLKAGTPVVAGLHDVTASALGAGGYRENTVAVIAGTYSINETVSRTPKVDRRWFCRNGILPGEWNAMSISPASTANYDWFIDQLCGAETAQASASGQSVHDTLGREFERAGEHSSGIVFHPYLFGSPFGGVSSAGFFGLNAWHDRGDMLRALIEGIAFNHRYHVEALRNGFSPETARLTGGISRNRAIAALFADVLGMPVSVTQTDEAAAWGAALCAGTGAGVFAAPTADPRDLAAIETVYQPDAERQRRLDRKYGLFLELADTIRPFWPKLRALAGDDSQQDR